MLRATSSSVQRCLIQRTSKTRNTISSKSFNSRLLTISISNNESRFYYSRRTFQQQPSLLASSPHSTSHILVNPLPNESFRQLSSIVTPDSEEKETSKVQVTTMASTMEASGQSEWAIALTKHLHIYYSRLGLTQQINFQHAYEFKEGISDSNEKGWTASFTCPVTAMNIKAGTIKTHLRGAFSDKKNDNDESSSSMNVFEKDGDIYYDNKKLAQRACVATVVDLLSAKVLQDNLPDEEVLLEQYCEEVPFVDLAAAIAEVQVNASPETTQTQMQTENGQDNAGWSHNPMNAIAYLHRLYNAKDLRASTVSDAVTYRSSHLEDDGSKRVYWTAQFQSPITSECFQSGILKSEDSIRIKGETFYTNKKLARMSAVGRAVDCFVHRRGWIGNVSDNDSDSAFSFSDECVNGYEQFCVEEPYTAVGEVRVSVDVFVPPPQKEKPTDPLITPKQVINNRYQALLRDAIGQDCFTNESINIDIDGKMLPYWSSTFECPVTGRIFPGGTLINIDECASQGTAPGTMNIDGIVYYFDKKNAEHAAAGRTFDILSATNFYSSFGLNDYKVVPRFCEEDPHSYTEEYADDEDYDEFVIQDVPRAGSFNTGSDSSRTTMDVVLDVWAEHSVQHELKESVPSSDAISTAKSWLEKMKSEAGVPGAKTASKTMTTLRQTTVSTFSCNAILKALANAHSNESAGDIEDLAREIIKLMISSSSSSAELPCAPDSSTFTSYMRCLRSKSPHDTADRAENFLEDMLAGNSFEGMKLPEPDCESFNAVMKQWLYVPGEKSQAKVAALFSRLESAADSTSSGLRSNKESFLLVLESLAVSVDEFNHIEAKKWICLMQEHVSTSDDDDMIVDTEVYNAPLPLPVGQNDIKEYIKGIYSADFVCERSEEDPLYVNAIKIENWFHEMERISVEEGKILAAPDIDTYEAVIQAWIKLASEEGLLKAEKWAMRATEAAAIDSDISPRLDTFRSLALAWAWSGSLQAPQRIEKIIQELDGLSETFPELTPDGELRSLFLVALRNEQCTNPDRTVLDRAQAASEYLNLIIDSHGGSDDFVLNGDVFLTLIDLWHMAASETSETIQSAASEIIETVRMHHKYTGTLSMLKEQYNDPNKYVAEGTLEKCRSMFLDGDKIHEKAMKSILSVAENEEERRKLVESYFHEIERFLLRRDNFQRMLVPSSDEWGVDDYDLPIPADLFEETLNWCKYLSNPTRNGEAIRLTTDIFRWTLHYQHQGAIAQSKAVDIYSGVMEVISAVVQSDAEKVLLVKKIVSDIVESNPGNNSIVSSIKSRVPKDIDVDDILNSARLPTERKSKKRKRFRKRRVKLLQRDDCIR